jgi:hypothetical protein
MAAFAVAIVAVVWRMHWHRPGACKAGC